MTLQDQAHDPRISKPHPHKKGWRCEIKTPSLCGGTDPRPPQKLRRKPSPGRPSPRSSASTASP